MSNAEKALRESPIKAAIKGIELRPQNLEEAAKISIEHNLSGPSSRVLAARGFRVGTDLNIFLNPSLKEGLPDVTGLKNIAAACKLINSVAQQSRKIALCCDFDVDGLSGGAQVHHFLSSLGIENEVFVPDRFTDGYGLNERLVRQIAAEGFTLLIAIDFGTSNAAELELASRLGLTTLVIDHHYVGDQCVPTDVFINPNQQGCGFAGGVLCSSGLCWYLLVGLRQILKGASSIDLRSYLDLACLGTICDMVPLLGANRVIARKGLEVLKNTTRIGLQALKELSGINGNISSYDVSFVLGPRINAAGRLVHGAMVVELLTTLNSSLALKIARELNKVNLERQSIEAKMKDEAVRMLCSKGSLPYGVVVAKPDFHIGVIGIVAQRLAESYYRPSIVLGLDADGIYKGSVRGIKGFNVIEALSSVKDHLIKFGGHEGAGGLSIEPGKLEDFSLAFDLECAERLRGRSNQPTVHADTELMLSDIGIELANELEVFSPTGMGNPGPVFMLRGLKVVDVQEIKSTHLKAVFSDGKMFVPGILWRQKSHPAIYKGAIVNIAAKPDKSTYRGITDLQLTLQAAEGV